MDLMWWWMWPIVVVAAAVTVLIGLVLRRHEGVERLAVAHADRLRALPAYRDRARRRVRCLVIAVVLGSGRLRSRPGGRQIAGDRR